MSVMRQFISVGCGVLLTSSLAFPVIAQTANSLGTVRVSQRVMANGQALPPGTYTVQLSNDPVTQVVGQPPASTRWVEFVQGGQVKGRELATVLAPAEVKEVAKGGAPTAGASKVQTLKGNDYVRVWLNQRGTQYLIHLSAAK